MQGSPNLLQLESFPTKLPVSNIAYMSVLFPKLVLILKRVKKLSLLTGHGGQWIFEMSRLLHFLEDWLTDCGEVVIPMNQLHFAYHEDSRPLLMLEAVLTPGP
jgi:hypothetical protein